MRRTLALAALLLIPGATGLTVAPLRAASSVNSLDDLDLGQENLIVTFEVGGIT